MSLKCSNNSYIVQNITGSALEFDSSCSSVIDASQASAQVHSPPPIPRRSCTGRNKSGCCSIRTLLTVAPHNIDHHEWVKYGEKKINGCKFHRCYYRCTYHKDGCQAKKQVQQKEHSDPPSYVVTYKGEHTCKLPTLPDRQLTMRGCMSKLAQEQLPSYSNTNFLTFDGVGGCSASYPVAHPPEPLSLCSSSNLQYGAQQKHRYPISLRNSPEQDLVEETICAVDDQQKDKCTFNEHAPGDRVNFSESLEVQPDLYDDLILWNGVDDVFSWNDIDDAILPGENLPPWDNWSEICMEMENDHVREDF